MADIQEWSDTRWLVTAYTASGLMFTLGLEKSLVEAQERLSKAETAFANGEFVDGYNTGISGRKRYILLNPDTIEAITIDEY